jgi:predicted secreted Zn-dependent protease
VDGQLGPGCSVPAKEVAVSGTMALLMALLIPAEAPDEGLVVKQEEVYYDVAGTTKKELDAAVEQRVGRRIGLTEWHVGWEFFAVTNGSECSVGTVLTTVNITVRLPRWTNASDADAELRLWWTLQAREIRQHEQVHVDNAIAAAKAIHKALRQVPPASDCATLGDDLKRTARPLLDEAERKARGYDLRYGMLPWVEHRGDGGW